MTRDRRTVLLKALTWAACLTPLGLLVFRGFTGGLGANPIEYITHKSGFWCLALLVITLGVTPLRRLTGWNSLVQYRRLIGLFSFFYGVLHFLTYLVLDQFFDWGAIGADILKRPYITVGFAALLILLVLAVTSPRAAVRRLGRHWQTLHRMVYVAAGLGVLHFYWKRTAKNDVFEPLVFALIVGVLMLARVPIWRERWLRRRASAQKRGADAATS